MMTWMPPEGDTETILVGCMPKHTCWKGLMHCQGSAVPLMTAARCKQAEQLDFVSLGIGGLDKQFEEIFRRAFSSRTVPPDLLERMGQRHVKGMLLYGPPGTGKLTALPGLAVLQLP